MEALFIFGITPRSGSNLLRNLVLLHPDCQQANVVGEDFLTRHASLLTEFTERAEKSWSKEWDWTTIQPAQQKQRLLTSISQGLKAYLKPSEEKKYYLTTTPYTIGMEHFRSLFPTEKRIFLTRDGRDVVESGMLGGFWSFEEGAELWRESAERIHQAGSEANTLVIKYEDVLGKQKETIEKVLSFLALDTGIYPFEKMDQLPVFGSSTNRVDGSFKYEVKAKEKGFKPQNRTENWTNYQHYRFNKLNQVQSVCLGYPIKATRSNPVYALQFLYQRCTHKRKKLVKAMRYVKRNFKQIYRTRIKAK